MMPFFIFLLCCSISMYSSAAKSTITRCSSFIANTLNQFNNPAGLRWKSSKEFTDSQKLQDEVHRLNSQLAEVDNRPKFHHKKAYEKWLIRQQMMSIDIENPYGYGISVESQRTDVGVQKVHKIRPRIVAFLD